MMLARLLRTHPAPQSARTLRFRALVRDTPIPDEVLRLSLLDILRYCTWALFEDERWQQCGRVSARHAALTIPRPKPVRLAPAGAPPSGRGGARPGAGRPRLPRLDAAAELDRVRAIARSLAAAPDPARIDALPLDDLDLLGCWAAFSTGDAVLAARLAARVARRLAAPCHPLYAAHTDTPVAPPSPPPLIAADPRPGPALNKNLFAGPRPTRRRPTRTAPPRRRVPSSARAASRAPARPLRAARSSARSPRPPPRTARPARRLRAA